MEYLGGLRILLVNVVALKLESRLTRQQPSFVSLIGSYFTIFLYEDIFDRYGSNKAGISSYDDTNFLLFCGSRFMFKNTW